MPTLIECLQRARHHAAVHVSVISCDPNKKVKEWVFICLFYRGKSEGSVKVINSLRSHSEYMAEHGTNSGVSNARARGMQGLCDVCGPAGSTLLGHLLERHLLNHDLSFRKYQGDSFAH